MAKKAAATKKSRAASPAAIPGGPGHMIGGGGSAASLLGGPGHTMGGRQPAAMSLGGPHTDGGPGHTIVIKPKKTVGKIKVEYAADGSIKLTLLP